MSLSNPSHEEVAAYAARQGITLEEAQAYFLDLLVGQTEYEMTGEGPEFAAPAPMFDLGEQQLVDETEKKMAPTILQYVEQSLRAGLQRYIGKTP